MSAMPDGNTAALRIHEREQDRLYDTADRLTEARESIKERLLAGKKVGRFTIDGAFEVSVGEEMKDREILGILTGLVCADGILELQDIQDRAMKLVDELLDSMADEIEAERLGAIADDYDVARIARACGAV